jgi:uncharacterized protein with HEPN domain
MNERDETRLRDMLDSTRKARTFVDGELRERLDTDEIFAFALVRVVEIIGEAASKISEETRRQYPQIRWTEIIGMRNKLIHDYLNVDNQIVRDVIAGDLPPLIKALEAILPPETNED